MTQAIANPAHTLDDELAGARRLLALLQQEKQHLLDADVERLEHLSGEKAAVVAHLFELATRRNNDLRACGYRGAREDMQAWLDSIPTSDPGFGAVRKRWADLLEVTGSAKELNRINGLLIGTHMARNQNALNALLAVSDTGNLYGPNGQPGKSGLGRGIVA
jgi:flagella synthesis protein FlgN